MCSGASSSRSCSRGTSIVSGMVILLASSPARGAAGRGGGSKSSRLQVAVDQVDLLQAAQALADVLRADLAHALDGLELGVGRGEHLVEAAELVDDLLDHQLGQARDPPQDAVAARGDGIV